MIGWSVIGELPKSTEPWTMGVWAGEGGRRVIVFVNKYHLPYVYCDGKFEQLSLSNTRVKA